MIYEHGIYFPQNQREYCELCMDRLDESVCPCKCYLDLPDDEKFDLENPLDDFSEDVL